MFTEENMSRLQDREYGTNLLVHIVVLAWLNKIQLQEEVMKTTKATTKMNYNTSDYSEL